MSTMSATSFNVPRRAVLCAIFLPLLISLGCGGNNSEIETAVKAQLDRDPVTQPLALQVEVVRGVASISGTTGTMAQLTRALEIAGAVEGVEDVENDMVVDHQVLVEAVRKALAEDAVLATVPIKVDFKDGNVRLMSDQTDLALRERAVGVATSVEGVQTVEDRMK
jgi:osmotically-inducible protein OsmY